MNGYDKENHVYHCIGLGGDKEDLSNGQVALHDWSPRGYHEFDMDSGDMIQVIGPCTTEEATGICTNRIGALGYVRHWEDFDTATARVHFTTGANCAFRRNNLAPLFRSFDADHVAKNEDGPILSVLRDSSEERFARIRLKMAAKNPYLKTLRLCVRGTDPLPRA